MEPFALHFILWTLLKKAKRLIKAVKRLKGCLHLVTAFWPKIIPMSEPEF